MVVNREDWTLITSFKVGKIFSALDNYGAKLNCTSLVSVGHLENTSLIELYFRFIAVQSYHI